MVSVIRMGEGSGGGERDVMGVMGWWGGEVGRREDGQLHNGRGNGKDHFQKNTTATTPASGAERYVRLPGRQPHGPPLRL